MSQMFLVLCISQETQLANDVDVLKPVDSIVPRIHTYIKYADLSDDSSAPHCPSVLKILGCIVLFDKTV